MLTDVFFPENITHFLFHCRSPTDPHQNLIKRVVALEGETVETVGYKNRYVKVPEGHCWIEGDNKRKSLDSNTFGPVPLAIVTAKATRIVWPPGRWQKLDVTPKGNDRVNPIRIEPNTGSSTEGQEPTFNHLMEDKI